MYCIVPLDVWVQDNIETSLHMFIDDIILQAQDKCPNTLTKTLAGASKSMKDTIEEDLESNIALHKSAVLASSVKVREPLVKALGSLAGPQAFERVDATANLGVDYTAGGRVRSGRGRA
eukprot:1296935-Pyramimonas_sp.AAC.1